MGRKRLRNTALEHEEGNERSPSREAYSLAFSELVTYITETKISSADISPSIFKLADLASLYKQRLEQLGVVSPDVNSTRLKEKLLREMPELEAHQKGRNVLLAFHKDVVSTLSQACEYTEAIILAKTAKIIRRNMLDHKSEFDGQFHEGCVEEAILPTLLQFVSMIEHGADIKSQLRFGACKTDVAMAQLLQYNCYSRYKEGAETHRHSKDHETPFPVYIGLFVFAKTRKKYLVALLHENGISVSYDRVLEISAQFGETVITQYTEDGVVCPPVLRKGLFTTSAMDNIDHNPTATTATTLPHIAASCQELTKCGCKAECHGRCKCYRLGLNCTALCSCTFRTNPCPVLDHKTYFGLYILSSMFLYTSSLKLLNNYENKQIILWCWCK